MHGKLVCEYFIFTYRPMLSRICDKRIHMSQEHTHLRTVNMYICYVIVFLR